MDVTLPKSDPVKSSFSPNMYLILENLLSFSRAWGKVYAIPAPIIRFLSDYQLTV